MRSKTLPPKLLRVITLFLINAAIFFIFALRLFQIQVLQHDEWLNRFSTNHFTKRILDVKRGNIFDRNGVELAISVDTFSLYLFTREVTSINDTVNALATVIPMTRNEIIEKIDNRTGYLPICSNISPTQASTLRQLNIAGVNLESNFKRFYPQNHLAAHITGFTSTDRRGLEGIELLFENTLRGYSGLAVKDDITLTENAVSKMRIIRPPMGGSNLYLTIDSFIQHTVESELAKIKETYDPLDASIIAMDPHTGEILAMGSIPTYNLNEFSKSQPDHRRNRAVTDIYEPGSSMKIFPTIAALQARKIDHSTRFYCRGHVISNGRKIRCTKSHGLIDVNHAIAESCNSSMVNISQIIDNAEFYRTLRQFGFGQPTGIEVPFESTGILNPPSQWTSFSPSSMSIGQEIAVTSIQLIQAYSAVANGGTLIKPTLINRITSANGDIDQKTEPKIIGRAVSAPISRWIRRMLMETIENGTGKFAALEDHTAGGKTSTAQKANPKGGYYDDRVVASFVGMAPALDPRLTLLVVINEPKGDIRTLYGGKVAAPSFARVMNRALKYLNVPPDKTSPLTPAQKKLLELHHKQPIQLSAISTSKQSDPEAAFKAGRVPDMRGKTIKEAMNIAQSFELQTIMEGNGIVISQTPIPGQPIPKDKTLILSFSPDPLE